MKRSLALIFALALWTAICAVNIHYAARLLSYRAAARACPASAAAADSTEDPVQYGIPVNYSSVGNEEITLTCRPAGASVGAQTTTWNCRQTGSGLSTWWGPLDVGNVP